MQGNHRGQGLPCGDSVHVASACSLSLRKCGLLEIRAYASVSSLQQMGHTEMCQKWAWQLQDINVSVF